MKATQWLKTPPVFNKMRLRMFHCQFSHIEKAESLRLAKPAESKRMSAYEKAANPFLQALACLGGSLGAILLAKLVALTGLAEVSVKFPWMSAASFLLIFSVFNAVGSIFSPNRVRYWGRSMYSFVGLALLSGLMAWAFSHLSISEAGSYRWIFVVLTFGYLVFVSIMNIARLIVEFAQREEWNHPRIRQKPRR